MRTLYLPVFENGTVHDLQVHTKRGLYNALSSIGACLEWDYLANDRDTTFEGMVNRIELFQPDLVLTQLHGANIFSPAEIAGLKSRHPHIKFCNWSGDSWAHSLTAPAMLDLAKTFDLWLCAAPDVLPVYGANGIHAAFWQIAFEEPVDPLPEVPAYDVVFLGNVISEKRRALLEFLRTLDGVKVGIYGDHPDSDGRNVYDFAAGESLYRNAKLAIADCAYPDSENYTSNRPIQIMAAGGALLLHQHVPKMDVLLGIEEFKHYFIWKGYHNPDNNIDVSAFEDLEHEIRTLLKEREKYGDDVHADIVKQAREFVYREHTYTRRVEQLLAMLTEIK